MFKVIEGLLVGSTKFLEYPNLPQMLTYFKIPLGYTQFKNR